MEERKCNIDHVISNKIKYKKRGKWKEKDVKGKRMEERMKKKTGNERSMDYWAERGKEEWWQSDVEMINEWMNNLYNL